MTFIGRTVAPIAAATIALACLILTQSTHQKATSETLLQDGTARVGVPDMPAAPEESPRFVPNRLLVKLETGVPEAVLEKANESNGAHEQRRLPKTDVRIVSLPDGLAVEEAVARYEAVSGVAYAEPDYLVQPSQLLPDDPDFGLLYGLDNVGQTGGTADADIDAPEAWELSTGSPQVTVAVIDTGIDITHPDLRNNVWTNPDEIPDNGVDDDSNGYVDDVHGWDFAHNDASVYDVVDAEYHGTHVAGTIAARGNNATGVAGVGWQTKIMPLKFMAPEGGTISAATEALNYALAEGVDISNNSWNGGYYSQTLQDALQRANEAGHLYVASAGNSGEDLDVRPTPPLVHDTPNMIGVAATDHTDTLAWYSNYGNRTVDLGAPGSGIWSLYPGDSVGIDTGTSMAAPHVSGTAALLKAMHPEYDAARLKTQILHTAEPVPTLQDKTVSGARLNAYEALSFSGTLDQTSPTITPVSPKPAARIKNRTPTIRALVKDDVTELAANDLTLELDSWALPHQYDPATDTVSAPTTRLAFGGHRVRITATDEDGNTSVRSWAFKVIR